MEGGREGEVGWRWLQDRREEGGEERREEGMGEVR
jgi:hypothetical protein